ncbi:MAG: hypothetical protein KKC20_02870 [Proteobacteria bacterium]|nr:hypothetical protein [Pseudomonadota bacterium]
MNSKHAMVREIQLFEFYKQRIWPFQRVLVRRHLTPRCEKCFLPETYSPLIHGICGHCRTHGPTRNTLTQKEQDRMQDEMDFLIEAAMGSGSRRYHVLVLFSGGKDSSYLLHRMIERYKGIQILALTVDNTFMSPIAMENVTAIIQQLGIDHMMVRPRAGFMEKMFRYAFTHLNERGCAGTVDQFDGDFFCDVARNIAAQMGIPYILCGLSRDQVAHVLGLDTFLTSRQAEAKKREHVAGIRLADIFDAHELRHWWNGSAWPLEKRPQMLFPFFIWNLSESFIKKRVLALNLMPRGDESPLVTNNSLVPLMGVVDMVRLGYSSFEPEFARMVRDGKTCRKEWLYTFETLEYAARTGRLLGNSIDGVLKRLSLTRTDLGIKGGKND